MNRNEKKKQIYRSMAEFEKENFPKSFKKRMAERLTDAKALGISLAKESLNEIRSQLAK
ncbi:MAG: hypothetical protein AABX82_06185 [Nanoarchaeota archaeon]